MMAMMARASPCEMSSSAVSAAQLSKNAAARIETPKIAAPSSGLGVDLVEAQHDAGQADDRHDADVAQPLREAATAVHCGMLLVEGIGSAVSQ